MSSGSRATGCAARASVSSSSRRSSRGDRTLVSRSFARRSRADVCLRKVGLFGASGWGSSMWATDWGGASKSSAPKRTRPREALSASTRVSARPRSWARIASRPPRRRCRITSPGRRARSASSTLRWSPCSRRTAESWPGAAGTPRCRRVAVRGRPGACQGLRVAPELALERDDVAVGVELRERQVRGGGAPRGVVALHEVGGHVVRGAERRRQRVGAARRERRRPGRTARTGPSSTTA